MIDYRLNDGFIGTFDPSLVPDADLSDLGGSLDWTYSLPPPFERYRYTWCPGYNGMRFSLFVEHRQVLTCAIAQEKQVGKAVWVRLLETCRNYKDGLSDDMLHEQREYLMHLEDPSSQQYYLKYGCSDLLTSKTELIRPTQPFLATLVSPPLHRSLESDTVQCALRLRNAVATLILKSEWCTEECSFVHTPW